MKQCQESSPPHLFGQIVVRLIEPDERERFDRLLVEKHYLHSARLGGRHMRYVAELNGDWIALIAFCGAAPYVKAREKWWWRASWTKAVTGAPAIGPATLMPWA